MRYLFNLLVILLVMFMLSGCHGVKNTLGGATLGGIGGGVIGSFFGKGSGKTAAIIGGTLAGAALGGYVGSYMDRMDKWDRRNMQETLEHNPTGVASSWKNSNTGVAYVVIPVNTYESSTGQYCRQYITQADTGLQTEKTRSTACRENDFPEWEIVSMENLI